MYEMDRATSLLCIWREYPAITEYRPRDLLRLDFMLSRLSRGGRI